MHQLQGDLVSSEGLLNDSQRVLFLHVAVNVQSSGKPLMRNRTMLQGRPGMEVAKMVRQRHPVVQSSKGTDGRPRKKGPEIPDKAGSAGTILSTADASGAQSTQEGAATIAPAAEGA